MPIQLPLLGTLLPVVPQACHKLALPTDPSSKVTLRQDDSESRLAQVLPLNVVRAPAFLFPPQGA